MVRRKRKASEDAAEPTFSFAPALAAGLSATLAGVGALATGKRTAAEAYNALCTWDCGWYKHIALNGYMSAIPPVPQDGNQGNVAFFPAYPLLGRALAALTGASLDAALPLAAQLACVPMFLYALALLARWGVRGPVAAFAVVALAAQPAAVYFAMGYSESLFVAAMLGYLYWSARDAETPRALPLAAAHGFVMCATRLVGVAPALFPLLRLGARWLLERRAPSREELLRAGGMAAASGLGAFAFFAYTRMRWGRWDLYQETQRIGWGVVADYGAALRPSSYAWGDTLDRHAVFAATALLGAAAVGERLHRAESRAQVVGRWSERLAALASAALLHELTVAGLAGMQFKSFVRYALPTAAVGALCLAALFEHLRLSPAQERALGWCLAALLLWQFVDVGLFTVAVRTLRGAWVA